VSRWRFATCCGLGTTLVDRLRPATRWRADGDARSWLVRSSSERGLIGLSLRTVTPTQPTDCLAIVYPGRAPPMNGPSELARPSSKGCLLVGTNTTEGARIRSAEPGRKAGTMMFPPSLLVSPLKGSPISLKRARVKARLDKPSYGCGSVRRCDLRWMHGLSCVRRRRWRDAVFEGPFDVVRTDQVCGAKQ
jgi:hypothetical protein